MAQTNLLQNRVADTPVIYAYELVGMPVSFRHTVQGHQFR